MKRRHSHHHGPPWFNFWQQAGMPPHDPHDWHAAFEHFLGQPPEDHWMFGGRRFKPWLVGEVVFNPFVAMALSKGGGLLPLYVLHLLSERSCYGNELMTRITERTHGGWGTNPGAIYPLLTEMEEQGLVAGEWEDPERRTVRRYSITETGRAELERLKAVMRPKLREALEVLKDMLDDLEEGEEDDGE